MIPKSIPRVGNVGARAADQRGHMCSACFNPHTRSGNPACRNAPTLIPHPDHPLMECGADCPECKVQAWWYREHAAKNQGRNR